MYEFDVNHCQILDREIVKNPWDPKNYSPPKMSQTVWPTEASVQYTIDGLLITEGACLRAVWYRLKGYPSEEIVDPRLYWVWQFGRTFENDSNFLTQSAGVLAGKSLRFRNEKTKIPISGEMDGICSFRDPNGKEVKYVIDYKTTGGNYEGNSGLLGNLKKTPFPKIENMLQLMIYLDYDPENLKFGKLVYMIRDRLERTEFTIRLDRSVPSVIANVKAAIAGREDILKAQSRSYPQYSMAEIYRRYNLVADFYEANKLPPRDYAIEYTDERAEKLWSFGKLSNSAFENHKKKKGDKAGDFQCRYCKFQKQCWEIDKDAP